MKECTVYVINKTTGDLVDEFVTDYINDKQLEEFMSDEIHNMILVTIICYTFINFKR